MGNKGGWSRDVYSYALRPSAEGHIMFTVTLLGLAAKAHRPAPPSLRHLYRYFDLYRALHILFFTINNFKGYLLKFLARTLLV